MHYKDHDKGEANRALLQHASSLAGLNDPSSPHTLRNFAIPTAHQQNHQHQHQYPANAILPSSSNPEAMIYSPEALTERIREIIQEINISDRHYFEESSGGNISDVHESFYDDNVPTYSNTELQHNNHQSLESPDLVSSLRLSEHKSNQDSSQLESLAPQPSTSTSSSSRVCDRIRSLSPASRQAILDHFELQVEQNTRGGPPIEAPRSEISGTLVGEIRGRTTKKGSQIPIYLKLRSQKTSIKAKDSEINVERLIDEAQKNFEASSTPDELDRKLDAYYTRPYYTHNPQVGVIKNYLYNGSIFRGHQKSRHERYEVNVQIQHVDYENSHLYGYLNIAHLTENHPSLTTFFEGEIISKKYPFTTRKWGANDKIDLAHWSRFDDFAKNYIDAFDPTATSPYDYNNLKNSDYIYMRWKERFLVPDHTVKKVLGASYEGFYYTCYSRRTSRIMGYYFHIEDSIESFQSLDLKLDCRERNSQVYEFR